MIMMKVIVVVMEMRMIAAVEMIMVMATWR